MTTRHDNAAAGAPQWGTVPALWPAELEHYVALAVGGLAPAMREARLLILLAAVVDAGGDAGQAALRATADTFRRLDARAAARERAVLDELAGPRAHEFVAAITREG